MRLRKTHKSDIPDGYFGARAVRPAAEIERYLSDEPTLFARRSAATFDTGSVWNVDFDGDMGFNLLLRFQKFKAEALGFFTNTAVPFTNNQAEQDIRMMKVQQKILGLDFSQNQGGSWGVTFSLPLLNQDTVF